jgi:hypothetical protein
MTVVAKDVRKVVVLGWDTDVVKGKTASIQADGKELRVVPNTGESNVFYPLDWTGSTDFTIEGSKGGSDTGTVDVTGEEESSGGDVGPIIPDNGGNDMDVGKTDFVTVSDMGGDPPGSDAKEFVGIALEDSGGPGSMVWCQVNVTDSDNGFGWPSGTHVAQLKDLGNGVVGA